MNHIGGEVPAPSNRAEDSVVDDARQKAMRRLVIIMRFFFFAQEGLSRLFGGLGSTNFRSGNGERRARVRELAWDFSSNFARHELSGPDPTFSGYRSGINRHLAQPPVAKQNKNGLLGPETPPTAAHLFTFTTTWLLLALEALADPEGKRYAGRGLAGVAVLTKTICAAAVPFPRT